MQLQHNSNISLFFEQIDSKGIKATCVYNWKKFEYTLRISYKNFEYKYIWECNCVPTLAMDDKDYVIYVEKSEELASSIEVDAGI